ncbi:Small nuclear RNA activating complex (SNAPc) [Abeliophyllum distichum]|uniref:Small nuclear RNA activating complex (SNAPc) n=1 Tax=Abeliophyllum distichum TaxID=126358 RepID=A0ABD1R7R7_9LAMI
MDLKPFELDIDELINDFAKDGSTTFAEFKRIWLLKKFSFIFEASPSTNQACFMQSLYAHSIVYMVSTGSLSNRVGALYLYCLYETQLFKTPFKIYFSWSDYSGWGHSLLPFKSYPDFPSAGDLKRLKILIIDTKTRHKSCFYLRMLERNVFLFGSVDANEGPATKRINELSEIQNNRVQAVYRSLSTFSSFIELLAFTLFLSPGCILRASFY